MKSIWKRLGMLVLAMGLFLAVLPGSAEEDNVQSQQRKRAEILRRWIPLLCAAEELPVSDGTIHIREAKAIRNEDGTYRIEVEFTTDVALNPGDQLTVTVTGSEQSVSFPLNLKNADQLHHISFQDIRQPDRVWVKIEGYCTGRNYTAGQVMQIPYPVHGTASAPVDADRILKVTGLSGGAVWDFYWVADLSDLLSGMVVLQPVPTAVELDTYGIRQRHTVTLAADAAGCIVCNFTRAGFRDGVYLAVGEGEAFYVCLPKIEPTGEFVSSVVSVERTK